MLLLLRQQVLRQVLRLPALVLHVLELRVDHVSHGGDRLAAGA